MSKKNAEMFLKDLTCNEALQKELDEQKPATPEDLVSFAGKAGYSFTKEEMKEVLFAIGALKLSDEELDAVSGGAIPAPINGQITDSISQKDIGVLGDAPAIAMGNLYQSTAQALANAMHNATNAQQQSYITMQATTTMGVALLYGIETASAGVATSKILG